MVWFRHEWPHGRVDTQVIDVNPDYATIKAEVTQIGPDGTVYGFATGIGHCERNNFESYVEKAETKALGRALAVLGYGTQFTEDGEFGNGYANTNGVQGGPPTRTKAGSSPQSTQAGSVAPQQVSAIQKLQGRLGWSHEKLISFVGRPLEQVSEEGAGRLIKDLNRLVSQGERG